MLLNMAIAGSHWPYRTSKSQKCDGGHVIDSGYEDRYNSEHGERSYPTHHHERSKSVSISDYNKP